MFTPSSFSSSSQTGGNQFTGVDSVKPIKFSLIRSGTYQPQHRRCWEVTATGTTLSNVVENIGRLRQTSVNPGLVGALGGLMSMSTSSQGEIAIPNQWDQTRGIFMLMLDFQMRDGVTIRYVVQGYTETPEFSAHYIDPNLVFYVNNSISYTFKTRMVSGVAAGQGLMMQANYHPLQAFDDMSSGMGAGMGNKFGAASVAIKPKVLIRPQDIVSNMANSNLLIDGVEVVEDFSQQLGGAGPSLQSSTRSNAVGSTMASRLLNAFNNSHASLSGRFDISAGDVADQAFNELVEQDAAHDLFLRMLSNHKNGSGTSSFTYRQLEGLVPGISDDTIRTITVNNGRGVQMHQKHDSMTFGKQSSSAIAAANLQVSLPSLMVECMLFSLSFTAVSNTPTMEVVFSNVVPQAFDQELSLKQWRVFEHRFKTEIIPLLRGPNKYPVDMMVNCQFNGELMLKITVAEEEVLEFISPTFCDGLLSPVITSDEASAMSLSQEMMTMCEAVSDQLQLNQERSTKTVLSGVDKLSPDVSRFKQGDVLQMPGFGRATSRTDSMMNVPPLNVPAAAPTKSQMSTSEPVRSGSLFDAFK